MNKHEDILMQDYSLSGPLATFHMVAAPPSTTLRAHKKGSIRGISVKQNMHVSQLLCASMHAMGILSFYQR